MSEFASPGAAGGGFAFADAEGHLVVIEVETHEHGILTANGERDAIRATVHDIDANETFEDSLLFPKVIVGSLKARIGQKVLARVGKGTAKPGQNAPWVLNDASGDAAAVKAATAYLDAYRSGQFAAPQDSAQAAPAAAAAAPAATPDLNDPAVIAALAALQKQGLTSEPPF